MKPTSADWKKLQEYITEYTSANLKIDGYDICISMETDRKKMKMKYMIWVNREFNGRNMRKESEIGKRFYMREMAYMYSKQFRDRVKESRTFCTAEQREDICKLHFVNFSPYFTSFNTMKNVFIDNNESIEIIKKEINVDGYIEDDEIPF